MDDIKHGSPKSQSSVEDSTLPVTATDKIVNALQRLDELWDEEYEGEQRETFEALVSGLNESRMGERQPFPEKLRGKTW
jgi:hypothetical protein